MRLRIRQIIEREICHYADPQTRITSSYRHVYVSQGGSEHHFRLPGDGWWRSLLSTSRLARRALRLDKCNVIPAGDGLILIRQGRVYHVSPENPQPRHTLTLKNCRNVLHQSVLVIDQKEVFFGEYGNNEERCEVPVYRSPDGGQSWETIFTFPRGKVKHVHGCGYDPYEDRVWVLTGDFEHECHILCADRDFRHIEWIGDGQQAYRTCGVFFEADAVHWIMDSQLEDSYHVRMERKTRTIRKLQAFPGPVWYSKRLTDGYYLAATAQEIGPGVHDRLVHFMVSQDLESWEDVQRFEHDGLPKRYFKFGVIGFADGAQSSQSFYIFAEAIRGLDGKTALCGLEA